MLNFADAAASNIHPFIGLRPFRIEDAPFFFGREQQIAKLLHLVHSGSLISVIGSSGSGKSSLVRAGLLPALMATDTGSTSWDWVEMRPGESPVRNLADALARPNEAAGAAAFDPLAESRADRIEVMLRSSSFGIGEALKGARGRDPGRLLIVVDQFEEIFRFADLRARRNANPTRASELRDEATFFVRLLLTAAADDNFPGAIVLTMRSDFIGDCARFHGLSEAVTKTQYLVPALTRDQRALAIRGPVERAGATIEAALIQRVLNDTNEDPDQLPVLQHAMMRCCQRAQDHDRPLPPALTLERYNEIGGIEGALTRHGDEVLQQLEAHAVATVAATAAANEVTNAVTDEVTPDALNLHDVAKRIFQSLTEVEGQGRVIRRPQTLGDLVKVIAQDDASPDELARIEAAVRQVVAHFADPMCSFLRAPTEDRLSETAVVDIGHEALIRRWERLGGLDQTNWVHQEREDAEKYSRLVTLADLETLPPQLLNEFETWWQQRQPSGFWARRYTRGGESRLRAAADLLARSRAEVVREQAQRARSRLQRRLKWAGGAAVVAAVAVSGFLLYIRDMRMAADDVARTRALQIAAAGQNLLKRDSAHQAVLLAEYALSEGGSPSDVAHQAVLLREHALSHDGSPSDVATIPFEPENMVLAYEALQGMRERAIVKVETGMIGVVFKPGGTVSRPQKPELLTVSWNYPKDPQVWNINSVWDSRIEQLPAPDAPRTTGPLNAFLLSVNKSGDALLTGPTKNDDRISLLSTADPKRWTRQPIDFVDPKPRFGVFAPDRDLMLTGGGGAKWTMWAPSSPAGDSPAKLAYTPSHVFEEIAPASGYFASAAISASGKFAAIAANDGTVRVYQGHGNASDWSLVGAPLHPSTSKPDACPNGYKGPNPERPKDAVRWLMFDPNNPNRLIGGYDQAGNIDVWEVASGSASTLETCGERPVFRATFSPDGQYVAAAVLEQPRIYVWTMSSLNAGPGSRESPLALQGSPEDGFFASVTFDDHDHIAAGTAHGKVWLWDMQAALSRDLPSNLPARQSSPPVGTACEGGSADTTQVERTSQNDPWRVASKVAHVAHGKLTIPDATELPIIACKISSDGERMILTPSQGRLLLYDLRYLNSPVGVFGEDGARWRGADFAENPDRIVATSDAGALRQWRFFRDKDALLDFVDKSLPVVSEEGANDRRYKAAELSKTTKELLNGDFWSLMDSPNRGTGLSPEQ